MNRSWKRISRNWASAATYPSSVVSRSFNKKALSCSRLCRRLGSRRKSSRQPGLKRRQRNRRAFRVGGLQPSRFGFENLREGLLGILTKSGAMRKVGDVRKVAAVLLTVEDVDVVFSRCLPPSPCRVLTRDSATCSGGPASPGAEPHSCKFDTSCLENGTTPGRRHQLAG